jgi:hypothetical protein
MAKRTLIHPDAPLLLTNHRRPRTRRELLAQSFTLGGGTVLASSLGGLFPNSAYAALSQDLQAQIAACNPNGGGAGMIPFICFDLAGGANIAGSNVLVGNKGGQLDFLSAPGYSMLGLPATMAPNAPGGTFVDTSLGLAFHSDSAFLRGIKSTCSTAAMGKVNGCVIPARSENDTSNNPHNPMYGIYRAGARGELINLIGSQNSDSGGNSMAPTMLIDVSARPAQVTRPSDVTGLVGTSTDIPALLSQADTVATMEAVTRVSNLAVDGAALFHPSPAYDAVHSDPTDRNTYTNLRTSAKCEIAKSADSTDKFGAVSPDPAQDPAIIGNNSNLTSIFPLVNGKITDGEHLKTASIMKLVLGAAGSGHYAAAGTISMGGFDYHSGDRSTGETRDFRAGQCMGACLEYAHRMQTKLMLYVFSDGSLSSNGMVDNSAEGRGKNNWDSDNQSTGAAFFLVYDPAGPLPAKFQQLGWMRADGSVETSGSPGANSVTQLVDMVVLNYLALHSPAQLATLGGIGGTLSTALNRPASSILGGNASWTKYMAFDPFQQFT